MSVAAAVVVTAALAVGCRAAIDPAAIADAQTAVRVKTALVNDPVVGEFAIEVRAARGVVSLSGRVRSQADVVRATDLARAVAGVAGVRTNLRVGGESPASAAPPGSTEQAAPEIESPEIDSRPGVLAVGVAAGWSLPRATAFERRLAFSPLIKVGSPQGLGPAIGFDWFQADVASADDAVPITRVHIRPIMLGVGYTLTSERVSVSPSVVAGFAFNSLTVTDIGAARGLPVEVGNSFAWRAGLSTWYNVTPRTAVNVSVGYLKTRLRLTVLEGGRLAERPARGDTAIVHIGLAYRVF